MHGGPLDKASDSDDGVEWGGGRGGLRRGLGLGRGLLGGRGVVDEGEEVGGGCEHGGRGVGGLGLAGLDESVRRQAYPLNVSSYTYHLLTHFLQARGSS